MENMWQLKWGGIGNRGIEQNGERTHGHGQQWGDCWGKRGMRRLNGNGKSTVKIILKNELQIKIFVALLGSQKNK